MKIPCPNPACGVPVTGTKAKLGQRVPCPSCLQPFVWAERIHCGEHFVIYDLETTGLDPGYDEFIQIAAMRFSLGCLCPEETFFSYARPRMRIPAFITSYTGVTNRDVEHAPRPEEVLGRFAAWSGDATLIAHNGLRFDSRFLTATCVRHNLPSREVHGIDSIHLSKLLFGNARGTGHALDRVLARLRISGDGVRRHDARGDVELLGWAVAAMWSRLGLDTSFNGVARHMTHLPVTGG